MTLGIISKTLRAYFVRWNVVWRTRWGAHTELWKLLVLVRLTTLLELRIPWFYWVTINLVIATSLHFKMHQCKGIFILLFYDRTLLCHRHRVPRILSEKCSESTLSIPDKAFHVVLGAQSMFLLAFRSRYQLLVSWVVRWFPDLAGKETSEWTPVLCYDFMVAARYMQDGATGNWTPAMKSLLA